MCCSAFMSSASFDLLYPFSITIQPFSFSFSFCCPISQAVILILYFHTGCRSCLSARCTLHTLTSAKTHTRTLSNTTLSTWRKTHTAQRQANTEQRKWLTMSKNACAYTHMHTLIYLLNTLHWYPFSSEMYCMPVYISVNVCVCAWWHRRRDTVSPQRDKMTDTRYTPAFSFNLS